MLATLTFTLAQTYPQPQELMGCDRPDSPCFFAVAAADEAPAVESSIEVGVKSWQRG